MKVQRDKMCKAFSVFAVPSNSVTMMMDDVAVTLGTEPRE